MERKLASIQVIDSLTPIEGADRIECARVMGWNVVVKKGEFTSGSLCVYFEIDSVLPADCSWSDFLKDKKYRVKTAKMRKCLSQGLALPFINFTEEQQEKLKSLSVGDDVTELLSVKKYEIPETGSFKGCNSAGNFPYFLHKTDEIRVQSALDVLQELKDKPYYITTKCDGTSCTIFRFKEEFGVCSRNFLLKKEEESVYWKVAKKYNLEEILPEGYAIQAEVVGIGIQKNRLKLSDYDLLVFNVFDIEKQRHLDLLEFKEFCNKLNLKIVPIDEVGECFNYSLEALLEMAKGKYSNTQNNREGIVIRPQVGFFSRCLRGRLSFKVLNNDYLLKDED
jgi:RNA ligase (TIGR02306 family)